MISESKRNEEMKPFSLTGEGILISAFLDIETLDYRMLGVR